MSIKWKVQVTEMGLRNSEPLLHCFYTFSDFYCPQNTEPLFSIFRLYAINTLTRHIIKKVYSLHPLRGYAMFMNQFESIVSVLNDL